MSLEEAATRAVENLIERPWGPMAFRFAIQPAMAAAIGIRDGIRDGRSDRTWYFLSIILPDEDRLGNLQGGLRATSRVIIFAMILDTIYQLVFLEAFYPGEAIAVAFFLGFFPYLLVRGPVARIVKHVEDKDRKDGFR